MSKAFLVHDRRPEVSHRHFCVDTCGYPDAYAMYVYGYRITLVNAANGLVSRAAARCLARSPGPRQGGERPRGVCVTARQPAGLSAPRGSPVTRTTAPSEGGEF